MKTLGLAVALAFVLASPATAQMIVTPETCEQAIEPLRSMNKGINSLVNVLSNFNEPEVAGEVGQAFRKHKITRLALVSSLNEYNDAVKKLEYALTLCANPKLY
jgi:hypothetical protein